MSANRGRLVFAAGAFLLLVIAVVAVALSGGSGGDDADDDPCLTEWNDDPIALSDGVHAYDTHTYRATLLTRIDAEGELEADAVGEAPGPEARCAVIFASPKVDAEPDFGVRVLDAGRWTGLVQSDRAELDRIAELQRDATETANVTLLPDGRLAAN
jgi:hypothetical protein